MATPLTTPFAKPGQFWRGNLHGHTTRSDGHRSPEEVCAFYRGAGYDFIALTDHFLERYGWPLTEGPATPGLTTILGAELHPTRDRMELGEMWHIVAVGLPAGFAPTAPDETGPQLAARAAEAGAFVFAAHPQWFAMTERDMLALDAAAGVEIFNAGCGEDNDTAESAYMLDQMLDRGRRLLACATDDSHFTPNARDHLAGWVMVKSERNEPEEIVAALKAGDFYASTGAGIYDLDLTPGERLRLRCSPVSRAFAIGGPAVYRIAAAQGMTEAEFDLRDWRSPFVRVVVRDDTGRKAWTNPIWLD
ncbi:MAG TPA: CehA/McbA family metallohydrolase [Thermomicrobiales bacterium]|nr:CehA/McbA family metallohydrolase [Thermomicrobiales bacterium]